MKLLFIAFADTVIIDSRTGRLSIINFIEEIPALQFPFAIPNVTVVATFEREEGDADDAEFQLTFKLNNEQIFSAPTSISFGELPRSRAIMNLNMLVVSAPGHLTVSIDKGDTSLGNWDLIVHEVEQEMTATSD